jgi:predicted nucleic-acid-binding protein
VIGLDTNLLIRLVIDDDQKQFIQAGQVIDSLSEDDPGWVGLAVIMELVWVLNKTYRIARPGIIHFLSDLLSRKEIIVEQEAVIRQALNAYRNANIGFADCLILASAQAAGCAQTLTFDQDAAKFIGMTLIS